MCDLNQRLGIKTKSLLNIYLIFNINNYSLSDANGNAQNIIVDFYEYIMTCEILDTCELSASNSLIILARVNCAIYNVTFIIPLEPG